MHRLNTSPPPPPQSECRAWFLTEYMQNILWDSNMITNLAKNSSRNETEFRPMISGEEASLDFEDSLRWPVFFLSPVRPKKTIFLGHFFYDKFQNRCEAAIKRVFNTKTSAKRPILAVFSFCRINFRTKSLFGKGSYFLRKNHPNLKNTVAGTQCKYFGKLITFWSSFRMCVFVCVCCCCCFFFFFGGGGGRTLDCVFSPWFTQRLQ